MSEESSKLAYKFNSALKKLGRIYLTKKKGAFDEAKAYRTNKRLHFVIGTYPMFIFEMAGPYYLKYGKLIQEERWDEFLKMDFKDEKLSYKDTPDGSVKSEKEMNDHINFVKDLWKNAPEEERKIMGGLAQDMLSAYCQYVLLMKNAPVKKK